MNRKPLIKSVVKVSRCFSNLCGSNEIDDFDVLVHKSMQPRIEHPVIDGERQLFENMDQDQFFSLWVIEKRPHMR